MPRHYERKIYQLWVFDGRMKWHLNRSSANLAEILERFNRVTRFDPEFPYRDWMGFSWQVTNKATGEVLKRHIGKVAKYARED
jgi:hypothetical protein